MLTSGEGDFTFSNDPHNIMAAALQLVIGLSVASLILEFFLAFCFEDSFKMWVITLLCYHAAVEDTGQLVLYSWVASSQATAGVGYLGAVVGIIQSAAFALNRIVELTCSGRHARGGLQSRP